MNTVYRLIVAGVLFMSQSSCFAGNDEKYKTGVLDVQKVLQQVIDHKLLDTYFHTDVFPERIPLVIVKRDILTGVELQKFGRKVELASRADILKQKKPYLEFSQLDINRDRALIVLRYPPEGIMGEFHLEKQQHVWKVTDSKIVER